MTGIFLVGCPRSGTTLLQSMMASHPQVVSFPETHFFSHTLPINPLLRRLKIYGKKEQDFVRRFLEKHNYTTVSASEIDESKKYLHNSWCRKVVSILDKIAIKDEGDLSQESRYWLEKTPRHLHYISSIESTRPGHKFLHILREGKHVVASLHLATQRHPDQWDGERSVHKCISWWKQDVKQSLKYVDNPNHLLVVYEQLISDPQLVLNKICRFLSLPFDRQMLSEYHKTADQITEEGEQWKSRNYETDLTKSNKLQQHYDEETIAYITRKTSFMNISDLYL